MGAPSSQPLLWNRLDIHDRKQFELKLEYQPCSGKDGQSRYLVETFIFLPNSLNVTADTYPRASFYADIHNYVRLKTPVLSFEDLLSADHSPLVRLERRLEAGRLSPEADLVYLAKLLSCAFRGALRRMVRGVNEHCDLVRSNPNAAPEPAAFDEAVRQSAFCVEKLLARFRSFTKRLIGTVPNLEERTRASLRLVDEYMSLSVEQFFRKSVADAEQLPRSAIYVELRKLLMAGVIREEQYRKDNQLRSVLSPTGDNEEYMHRIGFLKKFCMNILFLTAQRDARHQGWEEVLLAMAAGVAMAFATAVAFWAQQRMPQISLNFFLIVVVGYMAKDRIKEGCRRIFSSFGRRHLFDRASFIHDPVTKRRMGTLKEKVDYGRSVNVPAEVRALRRRDDFVTVAEGELAETVIRYQKQIVLNPDMLPRVREGVTGVTDIIRLNVDRLLRDMDDPEYAIEYVDLEDLKVGKVRGAKSYQVDLAFRFTVGEGEQKRMSLQLVRLVLDRNGIKRMLRFEPEPGPSAGSIPPPTPVRSVA